MGETVFNGCSGLKSVTLLDGAEQIGVRAFAGCDYIKAGDEDVSSDIFARGLCLPSDIKNTEEDMELIIRTVRDLFA